MLWLGGENMTTKGTENIKKYRHRRKELLLQAFGNKCQVCGYNRCQKALEFHHLDPFKKEFDFSKTIISWEKTKNELKKCICVCANCHREIHDGLIEIDTDKTYFDENIIHDYNPSHPLDESYYDICPICGNKKLKTKKTCSRACNNKMHQKIDWEKYDIIDMIENQKISFCSIGRLLNVSDNAVRKRYKKNKK